MDISIRYHVVCYTPQGDFVSIISGMGRNRGTWNSCHGRTQAYAWARKCRTDDTSFIFKVEGY